jgi:elongation factor 1-gamma
VVAVVQQKCSRAASHPPALPFFSSLQKEDGAKEALKKAFGVLDKILESRTYLVGHSLTLADIVVACNLYNGFKHLLDPEFRKPFPSLVRYYETVANQAAFVKHLGPCTLCTKAAVYDPKKADAAAAKPAPATPAAEAKPKAPKKADDDEDDGPDGVEVEKPKKDPLNDLPKSKMLLDGWKRLYSNTPADKFKQICCAGLWNGADVPNSPTGEHFEGYDAEGFSIWFTEHKYPEEQKVQFRALNAVSGLFQRCDYARKHAFAVISILKDDAAGYFPIKGFWIFRGQEINWQMVEECPDLEVYSFVKADPNDPATRARVEAFLCEDEKIDGCTNMEAKVFK